MWMAAWEMAEMLAWKQTLFEKAKLGKILVESLKSEPHTLYLSLSDTALGLTRDG